MKLLRATALSAVLALSLAALPVSADVDNPSHGECADNAIAVPFGPPGFQFPLPSHGACVSTVVGGYGPEGYELSTAAYAQNCADLEADFALSNGGKPYPYAFYGNPAYEAKNRADCIDFLRAFHTGQLPPGPA